MAFKVVVNLAQVEQLRLGEEANLGLLPELPPITGEGKKKKRGKRERAALHAERAKAALDAFLGE